MPARHSPPLAMILASLQHCAVVLQHCGLQHSAAALLQHCGLPRRRRETGVGDIERWFSVPVHVENVMIRRYRAEQQRWLLWTLLGASLTVSVVRRRRRRRMPGRSDRERHHTTNSCYWLSPGSHQCWACRWQLLTALLVEVEHVLAVDRQLADRFDTSCVCLTTRAPRAPKRSRFCRKSLRLLGFCTCVVIRLGCRMLHTVSRR